MGPEPRTPTRGGAPGGPAVAAGWLQTAAGAAVFVVTLALYTATMAPTVSFWDTGEFITCAYTLGIPHPPGSPLYVLLGRLFSLLPVASVPTRVVFMSVLASAAAVWLTYGSLVALARRALGGSAARAFGLRRLARSRVDVAQPYLFGLTR